MKAVKDDGFAAEIEPDPIPEPEPVQIAPARPDMSHVFSVPAVYANQFFLTHTGAGSRLTFVEAGEGAPQARAAVLLSLQDTMAFANFLQQQIALLLAQVQRAH